MKITRIEIKEYKSIKEPIEINFYDNLPTVLIGKNGSGKTNILEALNAIAEVNSNYFEVSSKLPLSYKVHITLSKHDIARLFPGKKIDENKCRFIACSGENCKIDRIESEYLVPLLNSEICEILDLTDELKKALNTYTKQLNKIAYNERADVPVRSFQIADFRNSTTDFDKLKSQVEFIIEQAEQLANSLSQNFNTEDNSLIFGYVYNYFNLDTESLSFQLNYVKPDLAPFEEKFVTVNETAIKREITKINKATKESCDKITDLLKEIDERTKKLKEALSGEQIMHESNGTFFKFIREVQRCVGSKHSFLRNESSDIIFKSDERGQEFYLNDKSYIILGTYLNKVYDKADKEDLLEQIKTKKDFSLTDAALCEFEEYLNSNLPEFDADMYDSISVEHSKGKIPSIVLHEKFGESVALNSTSAGRRWYFTYYFMKNTLRPGDLFIVDEPAVMLHPIAQKEVMRELLELQTNGIKVVYSTHSPYLVPNDWNSVHFVTMEQHGTAVTQENCNDFLKQVIGGDIFNLQEILEKYQKGDKEATANRCYRAVIDCYKSIETAAKELCLSIETIESWMKSINSKKFRCPKLETIITIASKTNSDISELI